MHFSYFEANSAAAFGNMRLAGLLKPLEQRNNRWRKKCGQNLDFPAALAALGDPPDAEQSSVCPVPDCATQNMKRPARKCLRAELSEPAAAEEKAKKKKAAAKAECKHARQRSNAMQVRARAGAPTVQGLWRQRHLRARAAAHRVQGVQWWQLLRARAEARPVQGLRLPCARGPRLGPKACYTVP